MKKIIGVVLIIGGLLFAALAIKALFSAPKAEEQIRSAVTIKDGRILPENEGKLVVVSGTLKPADGAFFRNHAKANLRDHQEVPEECEDDQGDEEGTDGSEH